MSRRSLRFLTDDPPAPSPADQLAGTMFAPDWPERAPAPRTEQRELPIEGTLEERYIAWRNTEEGRTVYDAFKDRALSAVRAGQRPMKRKIWEQLRGLYGSLNNNLLRAITEELDRTEPELRGRFEFRERTAA